MVRAVDGRMQRRRRGCKRVGGDGIVGIQDYRNHPVGTSRCDVERSTGNEFSRWSIEVVNPHSGPVLAKILKIVREERGPTQA